MVGARQFNLMETTMSYYEQEPPHSEPGPQAEFTVEVKSFDTSTFYTDIVNAAVERLLGASWSSSKLQRDIEARVQAKVDERLNAAVSEAVSSLLTKPIQKFDTYGHPVGEARSIEEIVRNGAETFLTETVDSNGRPTRDSYGTKHSRLEWLVQQNVVHGLSKEMKTEADKVRAALVQRASEAAAAVLAGVK